MGDGVLFLIQGASKMKTKTVLVLGAVGVAAAWYLKGKAVQAVKDAGQAINPVNNENIFYSGVNAVGEAVTGNPDYTLGGAIYDLFN